MSAFGGNSSSLTLWAIYAMVAKGIGNGGNTAKTMKKRIILFIIGLVLVGGIAAGFVVFQHPRFRDARWDSVKRVWDYSLISRRPLPVSYNLINAKEYRNQQRNFSFQYPKNWILKDESYGDNTMVSFYVTRNSIFWAPEEQIIFSLTIDERPKSAYDSAREKRVDTKYEKEIGIQWHGGLPWVIYASGGNRIPDVYPYPKGVMEFGKWRVITSHFIPEIMRTFRYDVLTEADTAKAQPWPQDSSVDTSSWKELSIPKLGVAVKYPPDWYVYDCLEQGDRTAIILSRTSPDSEYPESCTLGAWYENDFGVFRVGSPFIETHNISQIVDFSDNIIRYSFDLLLGYWNQGQYEGRGNGDEFIPEHSIVRTYFFGVKTSYGSHIALSYIQYYERGEEKAADSELKIFKAFIGNIKAIPIE